VSLDSAIARDASLFWRRAGDDSRRLAVAVAIATLLHAGAVAIAVVEWPTIQRPTPTEPSIVVELFEAPEPNEAEIPAAEDEPRPEPQPVRQSGGDPDLAPGAAAPTEPDPAERAPLSEAAESATPAPEEIPPEELAAAVPARKPLPPLKPAPTKTPPAAITPPTPPGDTAGTGGGDRYLNQIRDEILSQRDYPAVANPMQLAGTAVYEMMIDRSGKLLGLRLARSSGVGTLDEVGIGMIRRAAPFAPVPADIRGERVVLTLTLYLGP
jgi:protein TonB